MILFLIYVCREENTASLRALDSYLKEKLMTWLSPAALVLHRITWDDSASLLEKIVAYEVCLLLLFNMMLLDILFLNGNMVVLFRPCIQLAIF